MHCEFDWSFNNIPNDEVLRVFLVSAVGSAIFWDNSHAFWWWVFVNITWIHHHMCSYYLFIVQQYWMHEWQWFCAVQVHQLSVLWGKDERWRQGAQWFTGLQRGECITSFFTPSFWPHPHASSFSSCFVQCWQVFVCIMLVFVCIMTVSVCVYNYNVIVVCSRPVHTPRLSCERMRFMFVTSIINYFVLQQNLLWLLVVLYQTYSCNSVKLN